MRQLNKVSLFKDLSDAEFKELEPYLSTTAYRKKETIFSEGEPPEWFYSSSRQGEDHQALARWQGDHPGGDIAHRYLRGRRSHQGVPYPANAVAMEDSEVLKISRKNLMRLMDRFPNLMYCMAMQMGERMKSSYDSLKNIALERVEARIAALLLKLAGKVGTDTKEGTMIDMRLTKQDVADMVGTTVETSIRTFSKFKKQGLVTEVDGKIVIRDKESLAALSS